MTTNSHCRIGTTQVEIEAAQRNGTIFVDKDLANFIWYLKRGEENRLDGPCGPLERFFFWSENGMPDMNKAREFAEAIRRRFYDCPGAFRLYVNQRNNLVEVYYHMGEMECKGQTANCPKYGVQVRQEVIH